MGTSTNPHAHFTSWRNAHVAGASELAGLAGELEIGAAVLALDEAKLLVVVGPADAVREMAELVNSLDTPTKKAPDPEKRKKLFPAEKGA